MLVMVNYLDPAQLNLKSNQDPFQTASYMKPHYFQQLNKLTLFNRQKIFAIFEFQSSDTGKKKYLDRFTSH